MHPLLAGPEHPAGRDDREHGRGQGERGEGGDDDRDGQRRAERLEHAEAGEDQHREGDGDRAGRGGDRLADPGDGVDHGLLPGVARPQPLAVAEGEEQEVVGADAEDDDDQDRRQHRGGLQVERLGGVGDQAVRGRHRDHQREQHRQEAGQHAAEDQADDDRDQDDTADADDGVGRAGGLLLVQLLGGLAAELVLQVGALGELLALFTDRLGDLAELLRVLGRLVDGDRRQRVLAVLGGRLVADRDDLLDVLDLLVGEALDDLRHGGLVGGRQRGAVVALEQGERGRREVRRERLLLQLRGLDGLVVLGEECGLVGLGRDLRGRDGDGDHRDDPRRDHPPGATDDKMS